MKPFKIKLFFKMETMNTLFFQRKDGNFSRTILSSRIQHKKIEIVPKNQQCFSLLNFIEFAYATFPDFIACKPERSTKQGVYAIIKAIPNKCFTEQFAASSSSYAIYVEILDGFSQIKVYVKNYLDSFKSADNMIFFTTDSNSCTSFNRIMFPQPYGSMLFMFGNYVANNNVKSPVFLKYSFTNFQTERTRRYKRKYANTNNIIKMLHCVPGYVYFNYQMPGKGGFDFKNKKKIYTVNSCAWILPFAPEVVQKAHYMEIDASFYALPDYAFCIFHCIYNNESIPIALTVYPTEAEELYEIFFTALSHFNLSPELFSGRCVLADMHDSIVSFCNRHQLGRFICHRHLIERFGSSSPLGSMVARLLRADSQETFDKLVEEISAELLVYEKIKSLMPNGEKINQTKINNIRIMLSGFQGNPESDYYIFRWARWLRSDYHMSTCSNHSEGAHGNINSNIVTRGASNFSSGLSVIINYILNNLQNRHNNHGISFSRKHHDLREKIVKILSDPFAKKYKDFLRENCKCNKEEHNKSLYGISFPCIHKIMNAIFKNDLITTFQKNNNVDPIKFIIEAIKVVHTYYKKYSEAELEKYYNTIKQKLEQNGTFLEKQSSLTYFKYIIQCLTYQIPESIKFIEDYTKNDYFDQEVDPLVIKSKKKKML